MIQKDRDKDESKLYKQLTEDIIKIKLLIA